MNDELRDPTLVGFRVAEKEKEFFWCDGGDGRESEEWVVESGGEGGDEGGGSVGCNGATAQSH